MDAMDRSLEGIQDIINEFNDYFTSVFTVENTKELPAPVRIFNGPKLSRLSVLNFTVDEVAIKLERLRGDKPSFVSRSAVLMMGRMWTSSFLILLKPSTKFPS